MMGVVIIERNLTYSTAENGLQLQRHQGAHKEHYMQMLPHWNACKSCLLHDKREATAIKHLAACHVHNEASLHSWLRAAYVSPACFHLFAVCNHAERLQGAEQQKHEAFRFCTCSHLLIETQCRSPEHLTPGPGSCG